MLDQAIEAARNLLPAEQDDIVKIVLRLLSTVDDEVPVPLSQEERAAITASKSAVTIGELATEEQAGVVWAKYGL